MLFKKTREGQLLFFTNYRILMVLADFSKTFCWRDSGKINLLKCDGNIGLGGTVQTEYMDFLRLEQKFPGILLECIAGDIDKCIC